jgi:hypothetical protein
MRTSVERPFYFSSAAVKTSPSQLQSIECRKQSKICQLHHAGVAKREGGYAAIPNPKSIIPRPVNPVIQSKKCFLNQKSMHNNTRFLC